MRFNGFESFFFLWAIWFGVMAIVHIVFAFGIFNDSAKLRETKFVPGGFWALATLIGGIWVVGIYWLIHHSNLVSEKPDNLQANQPSIFDTE